MSAFKFNEPMEITIYFEENTEEAEVPNVVENCLFGNNMNSNNISVTQLPNTSDHLPHTSHINLSNLPIEADNLQMRPKIVSKYFSDSNHIEMSYQAASLLTDGNQKYTRPNIFHLSSESTSKQMNQLNDLLLSKNRPFNSVSTETSNVQSEVGMNSAIDVEALHRVSYNLVNIIWWKHHLQQKGWTQYNEREYQSILKKYFCLSYPIVNQIILPREHDSLFIRNFLLNTLYFVNSKLHFSYSYRSLACLVQDMIAWAKEYNKRKFNYCTYPNSKENIPQDKHVTCLFSLGAPGSEVTIDVDTNLLHKNQVDSQPINKNKCPRKRHNKNNKTDACSPQKRVQGYGSYYRNEDTHPSPDKSINNVHILNNHIVSSSMPESLNQPLCNQYGILQNNNQHLQNETDTLRSSISRDSGIASPLRDFVATQTNEKPVQDQGQREEMTPFVTHVTSLNEKATYMNPGRCHVCGSLTKNVCNGCYKHYYCTSLCQLRDWSVHWQHCSR